ncbi:hypothetical protein KSS87_019406 [Heliosperma pusillum]|nr:hypothetical protein KSS87_019406 [Heliosperma pusillum]
MDQPNSSCFNKGRKKSRKRRKKGEKARPCVALFDRAELMQDTVNRAVPTVRNPNDLFIARFHRAVRTVRFSASPCAAPYLSTAHPSFKRPRFACFLPLV